MPTTTNRFAQPRPQPRRQRGLSLVELMIALTIGLILLVGITTLIVQQSATRSELDKASRQIENGRTAVQLLHDDIIHAGFYATYYPTSSGVAVTNDPCDLTSNAAAGWNNSGTPASSPVGIYGWAAATSDPSTAATKCGGLSNYQPNTAVLVVRRVDSTSLQVAQATANATYLQVSNCSTETSTPYVLGTSGFTLHLKNCDTTAVVAPIWPYMVNIYYVSSCDVCTPSSDGIPTLKLVQAGPTASPTTTALVEGIENMQFDYGIDTNNDGYPDKYVQTPGTTDWPNVMAVRVNILARSNDPTVGYQDTKTYSLSAVSGVAAVGPASCTGSYPQPCNYKRHAFTELVRVINPSSRRAQQ